MELRKDYILDRWVYVSESRQSRPKEFAKPSLEESKSCFFCAGNESKTPDEIGRIGVNGTWSVRWFYNKFPAVVEEVKAEVKTDNTFFTYALPFGRHEIIAETPKHDEQMWSFGKERILDILKVYMNRVDALSKIPGINYVSVFKNHGKEAGASLVHSHSQVAAISIVPPIIKEEAAACKAFGFKDAAKKMRKSNTGMNLVDQYKISGAVTGISLKSDGSFDYETDITKWDSAYLEKLTCTR